ncbi:MAG: hypothetical protein IJT58_00550 [Synergistaceae bacterium]|nr:hypothetical protein [Synergistaceae bacterium]
MLKYTHGKWSWRFIDGSKPVITIDDGNNEINSLQLGDMKLIENAPDMFELLWRISDLEISGRLIDDVRDLLRHINVERRESHVQ